MAEDLPQLAELPVPLIVSVMATNREEFSRLVGEVGARDEVAAIELNVSCPNVHSGLIVGEQPAETEALLEALRPLTEKPLIVKLTPNVANPEAVAVAAEEGGADAVSLINTLKASAIDPVTQRARARGGTRGLSGPAVRPIALQQLRAVRAAVEIPVIGMGGVSSGADAAEFLAAGANLVAVGTENFRDPRAGSRIAKELETGVSGTLPRLAALDLDVEVETNFGGIRRSRLARPRAAAILAAQMTPPQSNLRLRPPNGRSIRGWRPSGGPMTSAPRGRN